MSLLTRGGRITVKAFAAVPALADLPEIQQDTDSVSDTMSTFEGADSIVNLAEGCFLTKSLKYTHQLAQWVNYPRSRDPAKLVSTELILDYSPPQLLILLSLSGAFHCT